MSSISYTESFWQWWSLTHKSAEDYEKAVLSFLPYFPSPDKRFKSSLEQVDLANGRDRKINEFHIAPLNCNDSQIETSTDNATAPKKAIEKKHIVITHGYGSGIGMYFNSLLPMTSHKVSTNYHYWCLDWLGMGRSSRPSFKIHAKEREAKIDEAESFFIDSLEEWRKIRGLDKFILIGHSLGGYLSIAYALKYPDRVSKLVLVSPVGIPANKEAVESEPQYLGHLETEDELADPAIQRTMSSEGVAKMHTAAAETKANSEPGGRSGVKMASLAATPVVAGAETLAAPIETEAAEEKEVTTHGNHRFRRRIPGWFKFLWEQHLSPFSIIRVSGPFGPKLTSSWTRKFSLLPEEQQLALHNYVYSIFKLRGSGEYALGYLLAPGAYARRPMIRRVKDLKCPATWIYGDSDWMDRKSGDQASQIIKEKAGQDSNVYVVRYAGHHLFLDNPEEFSDVILKEVLLPFSSDDDSNNNTNNNNNNNDNNNINS